MSSQPQSFTDRTLVVSGAGLAIAIGAAAAEIFSRSAADVNGQRYIDSELLADAGVTDLPRYGGGEDPILDIFVDKS